MKSFKRTAVGVLGLTIAATLFSAPQRRRRPSASGGQPTPDPVSPGDGHALQCVVSAAVRGRLASTLINLHRQLPTSTTLVADG